MSDPEQDYKVPPEISTHPAWARMEGQRNYYDGKAVKYQQQYKRIKLGLIALSAGIPLIVFLPGEWSKYVVASAGVVIAMLEGLLLLNQYGPQWVKYRSTAEDLNRERWLMLSHAGEYADNEEKEALRKLAVKVEQILDTERKDWSEKQKEMLAALAKTQGFVQAHMEETARRAAGEPVGAPVPEPAPGPDPAPVAEPSPGPAGDDAPPPSVDGGAPPR